MTVTDDELDASPADAPAPSPPLPSCRRPLIRRPVHAAPPARRQGPPLDVDRPARLAGHRLASPGPGWCSTTPSRAGSTPAGSTPRRATSARRRPSTRPLAAAGDDAEMTFLTLPGNGRGVYQVFVEIPVDGRPGAGRGRGAAPRALHVLRRSRQRRRSPTGPARPKASAGGCTAATCTCGRTGARSGRSIPRPAGARADADGVEPGGVTGVVCDVLPDGMDMVGWLGVLFIVVLLTGFYVWYWPGVRRWATAFVDQAGPRGVHVQPVAAQGDRVRRVGAAARRRLHRHRLRLPEPQLVVRERHAGPARLLPVDPAGGRGVRAAGPAVSRSTSTRRWRPSRSGTRSAPCSR